MSQGMTSADAVQSVPAGMSARFTPRSVLNVLGPFLILGFVTGLFAVVMDADERAGFFSIYNFKLILSNTVIVGIGALGMTMIIVSGGVDLSVGSVIGLTSVLAALMVRDGSPIVLAFAAAVGAGGLIGLINGTIVAGLRMTPFIVTLGMLGIARGLAKLLAENQTVNLPDAVIPAVRFLMAAPRPDNPDSLVPSPGIAITVGLTLVMMVAMKRTVFGRYIFAIGSNEATARLCGIRTRLVKLSIYGVAGLFFGLCGVMQFSRLRQGDPSTNIGSELDIIAAVVIGGASLNGGSGSVLGSIIGAVTMSVLRSGSTQSNWPNYMQEIIIGVVIVLAVGLDKWRQSRLKS